MEIDILKVVLTLAAGLVVFLYALNLLSDSMKAVAGEKLKNFLGRFTRNLFTAIISGTIVTILLDSSSAVIIMTIAFVGAGVLTFRQSMGVVMGANIGTTISSQIIAFDIGEWSALPMLVGFVILFVSKKPARKPWAK